MDRTGAAANVILIISKEHCGTNPKAYFNVDLLIYYTPYVDMLIPD